MLHQGLQSFAEFPIFLPQFVVHRVVVVHLDADFGEGRLKFVAHLLAFLLRLFRTIDAFIL